MLGTILYLLYVSIMSFVTMVVYGVDKRKAVKEQSRVPEKGLFVLGFFGGAIGGIVGMIVFSHKTKHIYFWILNILFLDPIIKPSKHITSSLFTKNFFLLFFFCFNYFSISNSIN